MQEVTVVPQSRRINITVREEKIVRMKQLIERYPELGYPNLANCVTDAILRHTEHLEERVRKLLEENSKE